MRLNRSIYGLKQASGTCHRVFALNSAASPISLFDYSKRGLFPSLLWWTLMAFYDVASEERSDQFCEALNRLVRIDNLDELRWYPG